MDQHPIPRQITTFEFKLIGFMTVKQFIYLVVFLPLGFVVFKFFPLPLLNILLGVAVAGLGLAFAFLPINERPLDVWIRNLVKRLTSPTQYMYHKDNQPLYFLNSLYFVADPHRILAHVESQEKLAAYLASTRPNTKPPEQKKQRVVALLNQSETAKIQKPTIRSQASVVPSTRETIGTKLKKPFFTGTIKNHKFIPLPGVLIYVKDQKDTTVRILKTNPNGVFATFSGLSPGSYVFDFKDPRGTYFFDTMKINIDLVNSRPFEFFSKELL